MKSLPVSLFLIVWFCLGVQAQESTAIHTIDSLLAEAGALANEYEFDSSLALSAEAEELAIQGFTAQSAPYGRCLSTRGRTLLFQNRYPESDSILNLSLSLLRTHVGPEHVDIANCLVRLGVLYSRMKKLGQAEGFLQEAAAMQEKLLGEFHPNLLSALTNLATVYNERGKNQEAEETFLKIQKIYIETKQTETVKYTYMLNNFGQLYMDSERLNEAEALYLESSVTRKRLLGEAHADYGQSLSNLGNLYQMMGYREKAEKLLHQALAIQEAALGPDHPSIAYPCHNLATLYTTMGNYDQAEQLFLRAQSIWVNALGPDHPNNGYCLNSLAGLYETLGRDEQSVEMYMKAAELFEKAVGKTHFLYAMVRRGLGIYYANHQQYELAEPLLREVLDIMGEALGKTDTRYIGGIINLAVLHTKMDQWDQAELLLEEARTLFEEDLKDTTHPYYLNCLAELASCAKHHGNYDEAISLYTTVSERRKENLGETNMDYATGCFDLAHVQEISGKTKASIQGFDIYLNVAKTYLTDAVSFLSEEELFAYTSTFERDQAILYASLQHRWDQGWETQNLSGIGYNLALFQKGFLQMAASRLNLLASQTPATQKLSETLKGFKRRLNEEMTEPIADRDAILITELKDSITFSEKQLARLLAGESELLQPADWKDIQAALAPGEAAIEFVQFERRLFNRSDSVQIAALVLKPGMEVPLYIPLTEQQALVRYLADKTERKADYVNKLYAWADRGLVQEADSQVAVLDLIWTPLASHLEDVTRIYLASAGLVHRINIGALPVNEEEVLSDKYQIVMLTSTRQILDRKTDVTVPESAWVFGGITFDLDTLNAIDPSIPEDQVAVNQPVLSGDVLATRGGSWAALTWTNKERQQIAQFLREKDLAIQEWSGSEAREEIYKSMSTGGKISPSVLHLATHGFFFPDPKVAQTEGESVFRTSDNPMVRSGLLLAGGNYAWQHGRSWQRGMEDGILTAYEISQMNLSNTDLVVLSACETGLGDIQGNEGVYGLQRAFKIAGAKYLIMSLWQVPDRETMQFMTTFYRNWLEEKMTIPEAFRKTQLEMRDRFFNPYAWAGFVLVE